MLGDRTSASVKLHPLHSPCPAGSAAPSPGHCPLLPAPSLLLPPGTSLKDTPAGADPCPLLWHTPRPLPRVTPPCRQAQRPLHPPAHHGRVPAAALACGLPASIHRPHFPRHLLRSPMPTILLCPPPSGPPAPSPNATRLPANPSPSDRETASLLAPSPPEVPLPFSVAGVLAMPHPLTSPWSPSSQPSRSGAQLTQRREGRGGRGKEVMVGGARLAPPLGEPGMSCHDNRGRLGGGREWGCGGVGSRGAVQIGSDTLGWLLQRPDLLPVFSDVFQAPSRPVLAAQPHSPAAPAPGTAGRSPSPPAAPLVPHAPADGHLPGTRVWAAPHDHLIPASRPFRPSCQHQPSPPPPCSPAPGRIPTCSRSGLSRTPARRLPSPSAPPELTLMRTSASMMEVKVCISSPSAMVPPCPSAPGCPIPAAAENPGLNAGARWGWGWVGRGGGKIPLRMLQGRASTSASRGGRWEIVFPTWFSEGGGGVAWNGT